MSTRDHKTAEAVHIWIFLGMLADQCSKTMKLNGTHWILLAVCLASLAVAAVVWHGVKLREPVQAIIHGDLSTLTGTLTEDSRISTNEYRIGRVQSYTLLQLAAANRNPGAIQTLLRFGANVNQTGKTSESALHLAVQHDCFECVEILLKSGASLNARGFSGRTPLFSATGNADLLELLLDAGADFRLRDEMGESALECLVENGTPAVTAIISNRSLKSTGPIRK